MFCGARRYAGPPFFLCASAVAGPFYRPTYQLRYTYRLPEHLQTVRLPERGR